MPITKGAKKAHKASLNKRLFNDRRRRTMRKAIKDIRDALGTGDATTATEKLPTAYQAIDKAAKSGIIKDNTAARTKSRLVAAVKKVS